MPPVRNKARSRRRARLRAELFGLLGAVCAFCGVADRPWPPVARLTVHHVDGITWNHVSVNAETRLYRYLREYREGVKLAATCRACNGARNQHTYGTRTAEEVPF